MCHPPPGSTDDVDVVDELEVAVQRDGLPERVRLNNGRPFASRGLHGLNHMSAYWLSLRIEHERLD